jgi:hypothetical protein
MRRETFAGENESHPSHAHGSRIEARAANTVVLAHIHEQIIARAVPGRQGADGVGTRKLTSQNRAAKKNR